MVKIKAVTARFEQVKALAEHAHALAEHIKALAVLTLQRVEVFEMEFIERDIYRFKTFRRNLLMDLVRSFFLRKLARPLIEAQTPNGRLSLKIIGRPISRRPPRISISPKTLLSL